MNDEEYHETEVAGYEGWIRCPFCEFQIDIHRSIEDGIAHCEEDQFLRDQSGCGRSFKVYVKEVEDD